MEAQKVSMRMDLAEKMETNGNAPTNRRLLAILVRPPLKSFPKLIVGIPQQYLLRPTVFVLEQQRPVHPQRWLRQDNQTTTE